MVQPSANENHPAHRLEVNGRTHAIRLENYRTNIIENQMSKLRVEPVSSNNNTLRLEEEAGSRVPAYQEEEVESEGEEDVGRGWGGGGAGLLVPLFLLILVLVVVLVLVLFVDLRPRVIATIASCLMLVIVMVIVIVIVIVTHVLHPG